jgi:predicted site-specific integrase-resolvase
MNEWFDINDKQPELSKLLTRDDVSRIVVEHKDRLPRF